MFVPKVNENERNAQLTKLISKGNYPEGLLLSQAGGVAEDRGD